MATLMILVTQDYYLFQGVKNFFPDIIQLDSSGKAILDNEVDEVSLLVDNKLAALPLRLSRAGSGEIQKANMLYRPRYAPSGRAFTEPEIVFKHVIITRGYGDIIWPFSGDE